MSLIPEGSSQIGFVIKHEDRKPIEDAAANEGRTLSQWLRWYVPQLARQQLAGERAGRKPKT